MIGVKKDIEKALVFATDEEQYYFEKLPLTSEQKTRAQERTYYRCFKIIWDKLGYDKWFTKECLMKWVFWVKTIKMWWMQFEVALKWSTKELTKEEAILLIDRIVDFWRKLKLWEIVSSLERQSLFNNN